MQTFGYFQFFFSFYTILHRVDKYRDLQGHLPPLTSVNGENNLFSELKVIESNVVSSFNFYLLIQLTSCYCRFVVDSIVMLLYVTLAFSNFLPRQLLC